MHHHCRRHIHKLHECSGALGATNHLELPAHSRDHSISSDYGDATGNMHLPTMHAEQDNCLEADVCRINQTFPLPSVCWRHLVFYSAVPHARYRSISMLSTKTLYILNRNVQSDNFCLEMFNQKCSINLGTKIHTTHL
jgi:hypothetical protein